MDFWLFVSLLGGLTAALIWISNRAQSTTRSRSVRMTLDSQRQLERLERKLDLILQHLNIQLDTTEFDVVLSEVPPVHKIAILRTIRELTGLGLKDAKALIESAPVLLQARSPLEKAEAIRQRLEKAGAIVTITPHL